MNLNKNILCLIAAILTILFLTVMDSRGQFGFNNVAMVGSFTANVASTGGGGGTWAQDVAAASVYSASGTTPSIPFAPTAGSFVAVWVQYRSDSSQAITSVTDNAGGGSSTYTSALSTVNYETHYTLALFYCYNVKAGVSSITVTVPTSNPVTIISKSYTGQRTASSPLDQTTSNTGTGTSQASGNITTTGAKDLVLGLAFQSSSSAYNFSAAGSFNLLANITDAADGVVMAAEDQLNVTPSTLGASFTTASSVGWWCGVASFTN